MVQRSNRSKTGLRPKSRLWLTLDDDAGVFGAGKWRLLDAIERYGSLSAAAAELDMSYRKAWGELRKAEERLGLRFVERRRGGSGGGEMRLTPAGKLWLDAFGRFQAGVARAVDRAFDRFLNDLEPAEKRRTARKGRNTRDVKE